MRGREEWSVRAARQRDTARVLTQPCKEPSCPGETRILGSCGWHQERSIHPSQAAAHPTLPGTQTLLALPHLHLLLLLLQATLVLPLTQAPEEAPLRKTQTRGMSPALRDPVPAPRVTRSHDPPLQPCLPPPPPLPPCPSALMGSDSAALFLTPRRVLRAGGPGPGEVALHRAAVPHHSASRCPRRWDAAVAAPPGAAERGGLGSFRGGRTRWRWIWLPGTRGVQLLERAGLHTARQNSPSLR